eukprot:3143941-Alexandrium_andersonii.AAC.1
MWSRPSSCSLAQLGFQVGARMTPYASSACDTISAASSASSTSRPWMAGKAGSSSGGDPFGPA